MSLIRPVIRMCAVGALRGKTLAEDRVYDSDNTPLADAIQQETKPYITIYTDEDIHQDVEGRDLYQSSRSLNLVLEIGVATGVEIAGQTQKFRIPPTDEGMELIVDLVESQALAALIGDPLDKWGEILRRIILKIYRVPSQRGGSAQGGTRWAARQVVLVCDIVSDPPPGVRLKTTHPVHDFILLAKGNAATASAAELIEAILNHDENQPWRQTQAWLGLTKLGVKSMGIAPITDDEYAPKITGIDLPYGVPEEIYLNRNLDLEPPLIGAPTITVP